MGSIRRPMPFLETSITELMWIPYTLGPRNAVEMLRTYTNNFQYYRTTNAFETPGPVNRRSTPVTLSRGLFSCPNFGAAFADPSRHAIVITITPRGPRRKNPCVMYAGVAVPAYVPTSVIARMSAAGRANHELRFRTDKSGANAFLPRPSLPSQHVGCAAAAVQSAVLARRTDGNAPSVGLRFAEGPMLPVYVVYK